MRAWIVVATFVVASVVGAEPALAGGSRLEPVRDRYEVGDVATLVGYTGGPQLEGHRTAAPYRAFLEDERGSVRIEVGTLELTDRGGRGWDSLRVAVQFHIPPAISAGYYSVTYCTGGCERPVQLGDLMGGLLSVGVDPPFPTSRTWPMDEPEIANLADDAILTGPGYRTTAGAVRAGVAPVPRVPAAPPSSVSVAPAPAVTAPSPKPPPVAETAPAGAAPAPPDRTPWALVLGLGVAIAFAGAVQRLVVRRKQGAGRLQAQAPVRRDESLLGRRIGADSEPAGRKQEAASNLR